MKIDVKIDEISPTQSPEEAVVEAFGPWISSKSTSRSPKPI